MNLFLKAAVVIAVLPLAHPNTAAEKPWFRGDPVEVSNIQLPSTVKVALLRSRRPVSISCTGPCSFKDVKKNNTVAVSTKSVLKVKLGKGGLVIGQKSYGASVLVTPTTSESRLTLNGRPYRGKFILRARGKVIEVIEQVGLEHYLYGVLPREVGSDWPVESLKAQAVISRTYVVANLSKGGGKGYDVTNNVFSQVYGGLQDEHAASNQAVDDTRGEILTDERGSAIQTFFHSSCGGQTESPEYVWREVQTAPVYLESIKDPFCKDDPFYNWELTISPETLQKRLRRAGHRVGTVRDIRVTKRSPSGRAWQVTVDSSKGKTPISGNAFRLALGPEALRSTLFTDIDRKGKSFHFAGHGWGHGVGLCQWGARGRALDGQSYETILSAYYPKVRLSKAGAPAQSKVRIAPQVADAH